jgi:hypothetical protein
VTVAAVRYLLSRYSEAALVYPPISQSLRSSRSLPATEPFIFLWYSGLQHNNENKPIELFALILFNKYKQFDFFSCCVNGRNATNYDDTQ